MTVAVKTGWPWAAFTMGVERGTLGGVHLPGVTVSSEEQWLPANAQGLSWGAEGHGRGQTYRDVAVKASRKE